MLLRPASSTNSAWRPQVQGLIVAAIATSALAALIAFLLARAIARPVRRVAEATRGLASSTEQPPLVPVEGPRELAQLAESFNELAVALDEGTRSRASVPPLCQPRAEDAVDCNPRLRGGTAGRGAAAQEAATTIVGESHRLERLVGDLLDLARMNKAEFSVRREPIDLSEIGREAVRRYEGQARDFGVTLELVAAADAPAIGDADRVLQIVSNLVENALRLAPAGGTVRIVTAPGELRVEDTGPGLKSEELERAFERFYLYSRYGRERPVGTGLGLAIVKELAEGMGGSVRRVERARAVDRLHRAASPARAGRP